MVLSRPKSLNTLNLDMMHHILPQIKDFHENPDDAPRAVLISGAGGKSFCAGGDIINIHNAGKKLAGSDSSVTVEFPSNEFLLNYAQTTMKPT